MTFKNLKFQSLASSPVLRAMEKTAFDDAVTQADQQITQHENVIAKSLETTKMLFKSIEERVKVTFDINSLVNPSKAGVLWNSYFREVNTKLSNLKKIISIDDCLDLQELARKANYLANQFDKVDLKKYINICVSGLLTNIGAIDRARAAILQIQQKFVTNKPIQTEPSIPKASSNLFSNVANIINALNQNNLTDLANELQTNLINYKIAQSKELDTDIIDKAHPKGSVKLDVLGDGKVENIIDTHLEIIKSVNKKPTAKLTTANSIINEVGKLVKKADEAWDAEFNKKYQNNIQSFINLCNEIVENPAIDTSEKLNLLSDITQVFVPKPVFNFSIGAKLIQLKNTVFNTYTKYLVNARTINSILADYSKFPGLFKGSKNIPEGVMNKIMSVYNKINNELIMLLSELNKKQETSITFSNEDKTTNKEPEKVAPKPLNVKAAELSKKIDNFSQIISAWPNIIRTNNLNLKPNSNELTDSAKQAIGWIDLRIKRLAAIKAGIIKSNISENNEELIDSFIQNFNSLQANCLKFKQKWIDK